ADLDSGYQIQVYVTNLNANGGLTLTHKTKSGVTADLTISGTEGVLTADNPLLANFKDTEIDNGFASAYFSGEMESGVKSGGYSGTMTYSFFCNKY
ncbi:MAG: hypothetical protein IJ806_06310, partial [Ruminococcus sp.]|nr:hypothetical protein [Ruminococcus sp.]